MNENEINSQESLFSDPEPWESWETSLVVWCISIGVITDFSKLKGMGRLALLYAIALFLIIAPIAYIVAYLFHHGMVPPLVTT